VLAGRPERKPYGLSLFQQGLAQRLILSVGRFEVRTTAELLQMPGLVTLRDELPPHRRHFWIDFRPSAKPQIFVARLKKTNTFWELNALSEHLGDEAPLRITIISTVIHLERIHYCCSRIPFFQGKELRFVPVPEEQSSFKSRGWWHRRADRAYVLSELVKFAAYRVLY
jgi:hypothetical protein